MRARNGWGIALAVLGVLSLAAAAILAWAVVPSRKQLPADTNTVRQFDGTARVLLNPQALSQGNLREAIVTNVPVTAERTVKTLATDGDAAEVSDSRTLLANGDPVSQSLATYAVDRKSLEATTAFPSDWQVQPHQGLTVSFPIGSEQQDYTGWVADSRTTVPITYQREESKGGVDTYVYTARAPAAPITDQAVLATLPQQLPRATLAGLASSLPLPDAVKAGLAQALPGLADPVQLSYTYESTSTYWVEPTTGLVVDTEKQEIRKAGIAGPGGNTLASVPVYDVTTSYTNASVTAAGNDAKDKKDDISTYGTTWPWILGVLGALLLIGGLLLALLGRRRRATKTAHRDEFVVTDPRRDHRNEFVVGEPQRQHRDEFTVSDPARSDPARTHRDEFTVPGTMPHSNEFVVPDPGGSLGRHQAQDWEQIQDKDRDRNWERDRDTERAAGTDPPRPPGQPPPQMPPSDPRQR